MKVTRIETRPLRIAYREPFHWAQGVIEAAEVVLVCVHTDEGITGYGESMSSASAAAVESLLKRAAEHCIGRSPFAVSSLIRDAWQDLFAARGNCSAPRFGALVLAGLDMALWDVMGKATGLAVYELLGGAVRDNIQYFGFPQGETAAEIAENAREWAQNGADVIYVKIGRGEKLDCAIAEQVRAAIGERRLRLDANEAWDVLRVSSMTRTLAPFDVEFIEQPTTSASLSALRHAKRESAIPLVADQLIFTPEDAFEVCRDGAADLIVLGIHETGGVERFRKAAAITEAAGVNICLHGLYESGITTCVMNQLGATLFNLDDGNQYMNHFLSEDILQRPVLRLQQGRLPVIGGPGFGFEIDWDAVARAQECHERKSCSGR